MTTEQVKLYADKLNRAISERYGGRVFEVKQDFITIKAFELKVLNPYISKLMNSTLKVTWRDNQLKIYISGKNTSKLVVSISDVSYYTSGVMKTLEHFGFFKYLDYCITVAGIEEELVTYRARLASMEKALISGTLKEAQVQ